MEIIIAEKPKVAGKIASFLLDKSLKKQSGQVSWYIGERNGEQIVVVAAVGHLFTLAEKTKTSTYPVFDIEWIPVYKLGKQFSYTKKYIDVIKNEIKLAKKITVACDYDIEGSLIGGNVYRFLAPKGIEAKRMKFSTLTKSEIENAYLNSENIDTPNINAGETRHILDWYYGINLSRGLMDAIRSAHRYKVMSIGRVQGPTLAVLANRELLIRAFIPEPFWVVTIKSKNTIFKHKTNRFTDESEATKALDTTTDTLKITGVSERTYEISPPPLFDLTTLQTESYRAFKITPSETLKIAQSLYEQSLMSYPRTSSQRLPASIEVKPILESLKKQKEYSELVNEILAGGKKRPMEGKKDDAAHPAIHPTGLAPKKELTKYEQKVYDLIVRRFLAAFGTPLIKSITSVLGTSGPNIYKASGTIIKDLGWAKYYKYVKSDDNPIAEFVKGNSYNIDKKNKEKKMTKPPKRYTEASIITELEKQHLGTKATRADIVETLYKREYIEGKQIMVTDFGIGVYKVMEKYASEILDKDMTARLEKELEKIQFENMDKQKVIDEGKYALVELMEKWKKNKEKIGEELKDALKVTKYKQQVVGKCPNCNGNLILIHLKRGTQFIGCSNYPKCKTSYPVPQKAGIETTSKICKFCGSPVIRVNYRGKRPFEMCIDPKCESKKDWGKYKSKKKEVSDDDKKSKTKTSKGITKNADTNKRRVKKAKKPRKKTIAKKSKNTTTKKNEKKMEKNEK